MPSTSLETIDAIELAELLQFIIDWLGSDKQLRPSFAGFVGHPAYGIDELQHDLRRFTFLLGGDDGEALFRANRADADGEDQRQRHRGQNRPRRVSDGAAPGIRAS